MASVTFDQVWKRYGEVVAVRELNLDIRDGEFLVLVGPSGCGKTTSLRMIAGLETISDGDVKIGDRVVNDLEPRDRDVAMVFQSYALYPHMTVRDNLAFGLKLRKFPKAEIERRVGEAARMTELANLLDRKPKELSGGQRQRVALGRAIVREPAVFLMDEPLSNLDAKLRVATRAEIALLHQRLKTTTVYVTHDQVEAMTMGDRIAVMNDGLLQQVGTPQELYEKPVNRFVAGFIGSPAMNFLDATVTRENGQVTLKAGDFVAAAPPAVAAELQGSSTESVTIGFRPEHLEAEKSTPDSATIRVRTDVVEFLGSEELLHVSVAEQPLLALVDADLRVRPGDLLDLWLPLDRLHVFDSEGKAAGTGTTRRSAATVETAA
ncbi:MAG: sn-glycerol-3-phosphate ABC transporter ATP-binding protein UgpC [Chloroflexi bacterium]|jgi:multiple sugar transport system ATP-binding protein|nr:sn-glycerol-3-phosphate ABC transporter ATP-binding protein UgpC [Chloroflexota bacterium]